MAADEQRFRELAIEAGRVFNPNTPINEKDLFAGRLPQILRVLDVVNERGQHALLYGERGVGKTSLSNVLSQFLTTPKDVLSVRVPCDRGDTFDSVWRKLFAKIELLRAVPAIGYNTPPEPTLLPLTEFLGPEPATPGTINRALHLLSREVSTPPILIIDEFDTLPVDMRHAFADTIKSLSDDDVSATVVLVGVGDSADQLIRDHQSVGRSLIQIEVPRMSADETNQIITKGLTTLGMTIEDAARRRITLLAQGLPHYVHLMGRHAARAALARQQMIITAGDVKTAIERGIEDAQQTIRTAYHEALVSPRKNNLFGDVLLACALAEIDARGTFAAQDVRGPLRKITGQNYDIPTFAQHLNEFSDTKRGNILKKMGDKRRYRFRFSDPLMQPYVIMQGVIAGKVPEELLRA